MSACGASGGFGAPSFDECNRLACLASASDSICEARAVFHTFDVETDRRHSGVVREKLDHFLHGETGLIAHSQDVADGERAAVEQQVERQRPALADDCDAALDRLADHLIRPERATIEEVEKAV